MTEMRKLISMIIASIMLFSLSPATASIENHVENLLGGLLWDESDSILSSVTYGDQTLILTRKAFYHYRCGESQARYVTRANDVQQDYPDERISVDVLFSESEKCMGLNSRTGQVYQLTLNLNSIDFTPTIQLEWDSFKIGEPPYEYVPTPEYVFIYMKDLYIKFPNYSKQTDLYRFSLDNGKATAYSATFLQGICAYKDGTFLAAHFDIEHNETAYPEIVLFNPTTDTIEKTNYVFPEEVFYGQIPMAYDDKLNRLYVASATKLYVLEQGGAPTVVKNFIPFEDELSSVITPMLSISPWGSLLLSVRSNVYMYDMLSLQQNQMVTLTVAGRFPDRNAITKALLELGNVNLQEIELGSDLEIQTSLLTRSTQADILVLDTSTFDIRNIIEKGYTKSLAQSNQLTAFIQRMIPALQEMANYNHSPQAIPISVSINMPAMNLEAFRELDRTPPATLSQLLEFIEDYVMEIYPLHPEYKLFPFAFIKQHLKKYACTLYIESRILENRDLLIDAIELEQLLKSIDDIDLDALDIPADINPDDEMFYMTDNDSTSIALMQLNTQYYLSETYTKKYYKPTLLPLSETASLSVYATANFAMLSPDSKNAETAIRFLETYIKYMDKGTVAMLCPFAAEQVEDPKFESRMQELTEQVELNQQLAEKADVPERYLYQEMADYFQGDLDALQSRGRFSITEEDLTINLSIMKRTYFDTSNTIAIRTTLFTDSDLMNRLMDGTITTQQFANEVNHIVKMITLEMQ